MLLPYISTWLSISQYFLTKPLTTFSLNSNIIIWYYNSFHLLFISKPPHFKVFPLRYCEKQTRVQFPINFTCTKEVLENSLWYSFLPLGDFFAKWPLPYTLLPLLFFTHLSSALWDSFWGAVHFVALHAHWKETFLASGKSKHLTKENRGICLPIYLENQSMLYKTLILINMKCIIFLSTCPPLRIMLAGKKIAKARHDGAPL